MAGYIKFDTIVGESTEPDHKEWINLLSCSMGLNRPMPHGSSGSTRQRGSVICGDVVCVKEMDASSPKLAAAICDGTVFPKVKIDLCTSTGSSKRVPYFKYELTNVMVSSFDISGQCNDSSVPTESFSLNYEEIKWTYDKMGKDGKSKGIVDATWKVEEGIA